MDRDEAIAKIKELAPQIYAYGASSLYLFGSTARNEAGSNSDVDVFVDRSGPTTLTFDDFFDLEHLLETALGRKVDLATREALHPAIRADIEQDAIRVL